MAEIRSQRFDALTSGRFFAAFYVLTFHFARPLTDGGPAWLERLRGSGFTAVSFFFTLSGFVLIFHYGTRLRENKLERRAFWIRRVARVYPGYLFGLLLLLPFALSARWGSFTASFGNASAFAKTVTGLAHLFMVQAWSPRLVTSWNIPGWSLSVEIFFYALFPLVAPLILRQSNRSRWLLLGLCWVGSLVPAVAYTVLHPDGLAVVDAESNVFWLKLLKFSPWVRFPEFVFGLSMGALFLDGKREPSRLATPALVGGTALLLGILASPVRIPYPLLHNALLLPLYGLLLWALAAGRGPLHGALGWRPLVVLGEASFALYILQVPMMFWGQLLTGQARPDARFTVVYLAMIVAASVVVCWYIERPAQKLLRAWLLGTPGGAPVPAPSAAASRALA